MTSAPCPQDECARLKLLESTGLLDVVDPFLDALVKTIARSFRVPMTAVSLVAGKEQVFIASSGLEGRTTPRSCSFCAHLLWWPAPMVINDALHDPRFCDNPLVLGDPRIRFYAGVPIQLRGVAMGALCIMDHRTSRSFGEAEKRILIGAGTAVEERLIELVSGIAAGEPESSQAEN